MKLKSMLFGSVVGLFIGIIFPYFAVLVNIYFKLPIFKILLFQFSGIVLCFAGALIFFYCSYLFAKKGNGTPVPIEPPKRFVGNGIYKYTRNPIYLGYFLIFSGEFLIFGHLLLAAYAATMALLIHIYVVFHEEPVLKKRFGTTYKEYLKITPRWLKIL